MRHFHNFLFIVVILLIESTVLGIFFELTVAFEYLQQPNTINPFLALLGFSLLGVLYKLIFEAWLIYSVSIYRASKKEIIQTKREILKARIIAAKIVTIPIFSVIIASILYILIIGNYVKILAAILFAGVLLIYVISIVISCFFANKYINKYEKNT